MRIECLGACIVISPEAEKVPSGPWNHRSPRGAFTLLGPDFIYQISFLFLVALVTKLHAKKEVGWGGGAHREWCSVGERGDGKRLWVSAWCLRMVYKKE